MHSLTAKICAAWDILVRLGVPHTWTTCCSCNWASNTATSKQMKSDGSGSSTLPVRTAASVNRGSSTAFLGIVRPVRPDYPIKTDRLLLRPYEEADLDDFYVCRSQPEVYRYLYADVPDRAEAAAQVVKKMAQGELTEEGQWLVLAVVLQDRVIGDVVLKWLSEEHRQGEIGYVFNPAHHGKGYAREAAAAMLEIGFRDLGLHRVVAECDPRNEPSWRVMERLGMRREAHFRQNEIFKGEWGDLFVYALLKEEYERAQA